MAKIPSSKSITYHEQAREQGVIHASSSSYAYPRSVNIPHGRFAYAATTSRTLWIEINSSLPVQSQDTEEEAIEQRWDVLFASSQDFLAELADKALADYRAGRTTPLDLDKL
jgi:hypothetical protein